MTKWLKEAGLVDVREEIVHVAAGKSDEDEKMREVGVKHLVGTAEAIADSVKRMGGSVEGVDLDTVAERYGNELDNEGGEFRFIVAVGRKPE